MEGEAYDKHSDGHMHLQIEYRKSNKVLLGRNSMDGIKVGPRDEQLTTQLRVSYMLHYNAE